MVGKEKKTGKPSPWKGGNGARVESSAISDGKMVRKQRSGNSYLQKANQYIFSKNGPDCQALMTLPGRKPGTPQPVGSLGSLIRDPV
jgi:hypothetical protein